MSLQGALHPLWGPYGVSMPLWNPHFPWEFPCTVRSPCPPLDPSTSHWDSHAPKRPPHPYMVPTPLQGPHTPYAVPMPTPAPGCHKMLLPWVPKAGDCPPTSP